MSSPGYRFLASPRWLGIIAGGLVAMAVCAFLADWQYGRYEQRAAVNDRVAAAEDSQPRPIGQILPEGATLAEEDQWTRAAATGTYDTDHQIFLRGRTVNGSTGWEIVVPLVLDDGTALLVDRGWVPPADGGAMELPDVPPTPSGPVTITGRVRPGETAAGEVTVENGVVHARRLDPAQLAEVLPYPVLGGFLTLDETEEGFTAIPVPEERSWQNFAYAYQWWLFAGLIPIGLVVLARREARGERAPKPKTGDRLDGEPSVPSTA